MMNQPESEVSTDWEEALRRYENVIACQSDTFRAQATIKVAHLSNHAPESILARTVPILVELLQNSTPMTQKASAQCLKCIACQGEGRLAVIIGQSGAVPAILNLIPHSESSLLKILLKSLRNIVTFGVPNRVILVRNGGLEIILNVLNSGPDDLRLFLLEILSALALLRDVRRAIITLGGVPFLVESAKCGSMISRIRAAQAIGLLGLIRSARRTLVGSGAIEVLIELLRIEDTSMRLVAGNALGVISSHVDYIRPVAQAGAIPLYAELLQGPEPMGKEIAEDVFCILAVVEANAVTIAEHLVGILRGNDDDEAKAAAADVFWDISSYKHSSSVVRNSGAIPILIDLLRSANIEVREKASGAVSQLSYNEEDRLALADVGAIPILIDMLQDMSQELRDNAGEAIVNFSEDPLLCDRVSDAVNLPSFRSMQDRLMHIRVSDAHLARLVRRMSVDQLTRDPALD